MEEQKHLDKVLGYIAERTDQELARSEHRLQDLIDFRREILENDYSAYSAGLDVDNLSEMSQQHVQHQQFMIQAGTSEEVIYKLQKQYQKPYFARVDFSEAQEDTESLYIGLYSLIDEDTCDIMIYDWRSPIAGIFYDYGIGPAAYQSPDGLIEGNIHLKRHFDIAGGKVRHYADSSESASDQHLIRALSQSASTEMKQIVQTIQKQQNDIIRDLSTEVLLVEGVAGSGKTVVALHRIAYLLYRDLKHKITADHVLFLSPNPLFTSYTKNVLPELGESEINQPSVLDIMTQILWDRYTVLEGRLSPLHDEITAEDLETFTQAYLSKRIPYGDIGYHAHVLMNRNEVKNFLLNGSLKRPFRQRASRLADYLSPKINPLRNERMQRLKPIVRDLENHPFDHKEFIRNVAIQEQRTFRWQLESMLRVHPRDIVIAYLEERMQVVPSGLKKKLRHAIRQLQGCHIPEWLVPVMAYVATLLDAGTHQSKIRHVVVDEAQDYTTLQYQLLRKLYPNARFTILGDQNQGLSRESHSRFDTLRDLFGDKKCRTVLLNESYRTSSEITSVTDAILGVETKKVDRHGRRPTLYQTNQQDQVVLDLLKNQGDQYKMTAIITKDAPAARQLFRSLRKHHDIHLATYDSPRLEKGITVLPVRLAKGLEFDSVIIYDVSPSNYDQGDRNHLYVAATRALHQLQMTSSGKVSPLLDTALENGHIDAR